MTGVMQALVGGAESSLFLYDVLGRLGVSALNQCFDAADARSYDGSSQNWTDIVGTANYQRGATSGAEASDPTFAGTIGNLDSGTKFTFDGGDYFTQTAGQTYLDAWEKDNGAGTVLAVLKTSATAAAHPVFDGDGGTNNLSFYYTPGGVMNIIHCTNNIGSQQIITSSGITCTNSTLAFMAFSFDEATTAADFRFNATVDVAQTWNASTKTTNRASATTYLGTNSVSFFGNTSELLCLATMSSYIAADSTLMGDIYAAMKSRYPSLP